jgi:hypothetical protein
MQFLGKICRLQVQPTSLKVGDVSRRSYDPAGIRVVPTMTVTPDGVIGWSESGERIDDIHNRDHPASKNRGDNAISIGFLSHYDEMRRAYGEHVVDGIAGENIVVEQDQLIGEDDIDRGFAIETSAGSLIRFHHVIVATPCVEFSRYAMQFPEDARPDETVTSTLQFLNDGMRGYYASYTGPDVNVSVGDRVFVLDLGERGSI